MSGVGRRKWFVARRRGRVSSMNRRLGRLVICAVCALAACNSASGRDPVNEGDAATSARDASADAARETARDGATMQDGSSGGDAGSGSDAQLAPGDGSVDAAQPPAPSDSYVYIGGWGNGDYPVKTYALNGATGALSLLNTSTAFGNRPSFITPNAAGTRLYMTNEDGSAPGITVATLDTATGVPTKLDKRADPGGGGLVHAAISPDGKTLLAADYGKGRLVGFPIGGDGKLGASISEIAFGATANTHSSAWSPDGKWAWVPNKGLDILGQLSVAPDGKVTRRTDRTTAGDGPRMITVASSGKYAYVMFENDSTVEAYSVSDDGLLTQIDREETLADDFDGTNTGGHALLHPSGKVLYVSNRGADTVVAFRVESDGKLSKLSETPSGGKTPRCFAIDASGRWMVVANQADSGQSNGTLATFSIGTDGKLTPSGAPITGLQEPTAVALVKKR
jgi:6-phosphogluconolactonase